ncbi:MAG: IS21 family transposase [Candidatus Methylomirabilaceae bacterium]
MKVSLWAEIHRLSEIDRLSGRAIAKRLSCSMRTVKNALGSENPPSQTPKPGGCILDPYKPAIDRWIAKYPQLSAVRILEEIKKDGYPGEVTLIRNYLRVVRPARGRVYQEVEYAPADAMQADWGDCGSVPVGACRRKVYVFVAVLCFSRLIYIEFALSQAKEMFYRAIGRALSFFGACPGKIIVDNLKAAVTEGSGRTARFHPEFEALCAHYARMKPIACEASDPESKGVVEGGVRYVKNNALAGRSEELQTFLDYLRLAEYWPSSVANVRDHETTRERPLDRFERERGLLRPLPSIPYDADLTAFTVVTPHARVRFDTNRYSVPPQYARRQVILRASDTHVRVIHAGAEIARHQRSFDKHQLLVDPQHQAAAFAQRRRTRAREIEVEFDALGTEAKEFRLVMIRSPVKPTVHLRRLLELVRLYGKAEVLGAISKALHFRTCDAAYVENLIEQERRRRGIPSPIPLSVKRKELLEEIQLEEPSPADYDQFIT